MVLLLNKINNDLWCWLAALSKGLSFSLSLRNVRAHTEAAAPNPQQEQHVPKGNPQHQQGGFVLLLPMMMGGSLFWRGGFVALLW